MAALSLGGREGGGEEVGERQQPGKQMSIDQVCYNYTDLSEFLPMPPGVEEMALAGACVCVSVCACVCVFLCVHTSFQGTK